MADDGFNARFPSKDALKRQRRAEREAAFEAEEEARRRQQEEERGLHDLMFQDVVGRLAELGIDPRRLRGYLREGPA